MTAIAAAEKKKKKDEMFYKFNTSRGMGYLKSRMRDYKNAADLFTTAIENAEPGLETALLIARSKANSHLVKHEDARKDALAVINKYPENIRGLENDAYTLYEKDDFENSLVRNYQGLRKRKKPDDFYRGILIGRETIEDCVGRNAGPCLDHDRLGRTIVNMHMKPQRKTMGWDNLLQAKSKRNKERNDRFFAQKYLGRLAADKQFMQDFLKLPDLKFGNKEHNRQLEALLIDRLVDFNRQQETLMTQRPMYMLQHHEPKFSQRYKIQKRKLDEDCRKGVMKVINTLQEYAKAMLNERKIEECLSISERLRRFVEFQPRNLMSDRTKEKVLDELYSTVGTLYMNMKTFVPSWSNEDNERRIEFMLYSRMDDPHFEEKVRQTCYPKIWNIKEMKRDLEERLLVSTHKMERAFLYHEIARCLLEEKSVEKAYKSASAGYKLFTATQGNALWCFNNGFLTSTVMLLEGNTDDAKMGFTDVMINARKLERDDCTSFIQKLIKIAAEPDRLDFESRDQRNRLERTIVAMMPTLELRAKANSILQKVENMPARAKLQLQPSASSKPITPGVSRRSMKATAKAKRRTLYEVKTSRHQTQNWIPSVVDLPKTD